MDSLPQLPPALAATLRYALAIGLPIAVQKGWLGESQVANVGALVTALASALYGIWSTHKREQQRLAAVAAAPPPAQPS